MKSCGCFAIPPRMFRRLVDGDAPPDHHEHTSQLRAARWAQHKSREPVPERSRKLRRTVYDALHQQALPGRRVRTETSGPAEDKAANEAFDNIGVALDFYREVLKRNSLDGKGAPVVSAIHYWKKFPNALWDGSQMIFGDGNAKVGGFTAALDIIAHELSHGFLQHMVRGGLGVVRIPPAEREFEAQRYGLRGQAGALNESFCDVMASLVKQWHAGSTAAKADWLIGDSLFRSTRYGRAVRSLKSPGARRQTCADDRQLRSFQQYFEGCDEHDASGIANHAFYLAAIGIGGNAWDKAGPIWFEAWSRLKPHAGFADVAAATSKVAAARHGKHSKEYMAVRAAWHEVQVPLRG